MVKGFILNKEYDLLWELVHKGYRIPAWILYSDEYKEPIYDLIEVKMVGKDLLIGTRGRGYSPYDDTFKSFEKLCKSLELGFVIPDHT